MRYIIDFYESTPVELIDSYLNALNPTSRIELNHFNNVYIIETDFVPTPSEIIESIIDDSDTPISLLEFTHQFDVNFPSTVIETDSPENWWKIASIKSPDFDKDNTHSIRGNRVNVYILDSGIQATHPEFVDASITNVFSITEDFNDTRGHGTALASVIAGKTCALSNTNLCIVKIFDNSTPTYQSDMLRAFDSVIAHREANNKAVSVVNISWTIPANSYIEAKIQSMIDMGFFVVCSAGNSGTSVDNVTPARMGTVLVIGSYNEHLMPSDFSNYSTNQPITVTGDITNFGTLDGWAPGENIRIATLDGSYANGNGTSISAAIHSAAIAYNLEAFFGDDDKFQPCQTAYEGSAHTAAAFSFSKSGLLNLDGVYKDSVNRVTTYFTDSNANPGNGVTIQVNSGQQVCRRLFTPSVKDIKFPDISELPYGLQISGKYLVGTAPDIEEKAHYVTLHGEITTYDDVVRPYVIIINILRKDIDINLVQPGEDPILDISLQLPQCCYKPGNRNGCVDGTSSCGEITTGQDGGIYQACGPEGYPTVCDNVGGKTVTCDCV